MEAHIGTADPPVFNYAKCAELHNRILDIGWAAVQKDTRWVQDPRSWWEKWFGEDDAEEEEEEEEEENEEEEEEEGDQNSLRNADQVDPEVGRELEQRLSPQVLQFLKSARYDTAGETDQSNFFYAVEGLEYPTMMLSDLNGVSESFGPGIDRCLPSEEKDRFVTLYSCSSIHYCHQGGILFDQVEMDAIVLMNRDNVEIERVGVWAPLEDILSAFLEMIEQQRIEPISVYEEWDGESHPIRPWVMTSKIDIPLQRTLTAWDALVISIEEKIPRDAAALAGPPEAEREIPAEIHGDLVRAFLRRARQPKFKYIAPGLRIPTASDLSSQPFQDWASLRRPRDPNTYTDFPVLLFSADRTLQTDKRQVYDARGYTWNGYPWHNADQYETGLYLIPKQTDRCLLLLPFALGSNNQARRGDGTLLVEDWHYQFEKLSNGYEQLYQPGFNHVCPGMKVRLELVFENWRNMIVNGDWGVDADGVTGGIEKFKEADTEEKWAKYQIPRTW